jgi:hypothetical protein
MRDDVVKFRYPRYPAFLWTLGIAAAAMLIGSLALKSWRAFAAILLGLSIIAAAVAVLGALAPWAFPFILSASGIRGWAPRTWRGNTVKWGSVREVRRAVFGGVACFLIINTDRKGSCFVPEVIARRPKFRRAVIRFAGRSHRLVVVIDNAT